MYRKLTAPIVASVRQDVRAGQATISGLARAHEVSRSTMYRAIVGIGYGNGFCDEPPLRDAELDHRAAAGELHGRSKLTALDVRAIRAHPSTKGAGGILARYYGVAPSTISRIRRGVSWTRTTS